MASEETVKTLEEKIDWQNREITRLSCKMTAAMSALTEFRRMAEDSIRRDMLIKPEWVLSVSVSAEYEIDRLSLEKSPRHVWIHHAE